MTATGIYAARSVACNDIVEGSDGDPATVGWDPATGLGSPAGDWFVGAVQAWAEGQPPPAPVTAPSLEKT